jgi:hypothetical protein
MIAKITDAYTRRYSDTGQVKTYVEWVDGHGRTGRTDGAPNNAHMRTLLTRATREGVEHRREVW